MVYMYESEPLDILSMVYGDQLVFSKEPFVWHLVKRHLLYLNVEKSTKDNFPSFTG